MIEYVTIDQAAELDAQAAEQDSAAAAGESSIHHLGENIRRLEAELSDTLGRSGSYESEAEEQDAQAER